jgi:serine/threonine protein kinase/GTPase SAR1 family protein
MPGSKKIMIVGPPHLLYRLLAKYEHAWSVVMKKKLKKPTADIQGTFPSGVVLQREFTMMWFDDFQDRLNDEGGFLKKRGKPSKASFKLTLMDETPSLAERIQAYEKFSSKKQMRLVYMLADVDKKDGFDRLKQHWNDEVFNFLRSVPRVVVGYSSSGKPVISNNEAIDLCFDMAVMEYMEIREDDPTSFCNLFSPSLDKSHRTTGMSRYLVVEVGRDKALAKRKPRLYKRLEKQAVDDALGTLVVAMIQWAGANVRNLVGLGDEDIVSTDSAQTCTQFIAAAGSRIKDDVDNRLQFLICGNHLTDFFPEVMPPGFWRTIKMYACSINNLEKLTLSGKDVDMSSLVELYASHNQIKVIDTAIGYLTNLRLLDLSANEIDRLPIEIFTLTNLEVLDVGCNKITSIPSDIGSLHKLKELYLDNNRLETLPFNMFLLESLEILELQSNQLRKLPSTLASLVCLRHINLDDNPPLKDIPRPVLLGGVDILRNFLAETSQRGEYCFRTKLMIVGQENVGKTNLLRALVKGATQKEKSAQGGPAPSSSKEKEPPIANGTSGTLRNRSTTQRSKNTITSQDIMSKEMFQTSGKTLSTDGIDIYNIHIETDVTLEEQGQKREETKHLTFSVWDFAGQEIYYSTHSFFLTDRSIFVVVFNLLLGAENCRVDYWLNSVKARTPTAPIFLIGTHLDKVPSKPDALATLEKLEKKYKKTFKIRGALAVSCESLENVETFIDQLLVTAKKEPYMGAKMPATYFALEDMCLMERRNKELLGAVPILTWEEVSLLARKSNFMQVDETKPDAQDAFDAQLSVAIDVLHLLGSVVRFKEAGGGLENYVILDPQWVTKIFATIITTKQNFVREGVIDVANLFTQLWRPFPPKLHPLLLNLLETFEIVFKLPDDLELAKQREALRKRQMSFMELDDAILQYRSSRTLRSRDRHTHISPLSVSLAINGKDRILIPALLPEARPDFQLTWPETDPDDRRKQFTRRYQFAFMPNGLFSRFMIRLLKFSDAQRYWRNGVLVQNRRVEDDQALIELNPKKNEIVISVRGIAPAEFFRTIIELLDSLLTNWFKIQATIHAVCPKCIKAKMAEPTLFSKEECLESSAHGSHYLQCQADPEDNHLVTMESIAPDIAMSDFEGKRIDMEREVVLGKELGQGAYGTVHLGVYNKEKVAIKMLITEGKPEEQARDIYNEFRKEVWIMSGLQHPCIVNLKGYSLAPCLAMVMELIPHGDLYKFLNAAETGKISWAMRLRIAWDIAKGMAFLHATDPPLLHRDMKSPNILMASLEPTAEAVAKVADFGLTGHVYAGNMAAQKARDRDVANPVWLAPEIIREEPYATAADVYPYGIILWELYAQAHPFDEYKFEFMTELERAIKEGKRPTIPEDCPEDYGNFIRQCWDSDPALRPSFKSIIEDILPPLINKYAPEIMPAVQNIEAIERHSIAVKKMETETATEKPWFNGTYLTSVETTLHDRIVDMIQTEDEVWCVSDRGTMFAFNADSGKLLDKFPSSVPVPPNTPKFVVSIRYDFVSKRLLVMTKNGLYSFNPHARNELSPLWVRYEGFLTETEGPRRKKKKQKWAIVDEGVFTLYRTKGDEKPDLEILLSKCTMTVYSRECFSLKVDEGPTEYFFSPTDDDPASEWNDRIELLIDVAKTGLTRLPAELVYSAPAGVDLLALEVVGDVMWGVGNDKKVYVWSWLNNVIKTEFISFAKDCQVTSLSSLAHLQFVRVGKTVWISYENDIIRFNAEKLKVLEVLHGHSATIVSMINTGEDIWSYAADNSIRVWDQRSAKTISQIKLHHFINCMVSVGPDVLIAQESGLSLWSRTKREKIRELEKRHEDPVSQMLIVHKDVVTVWSLSNVAIHVWK